MRRELPQPYRSRFDEFISVLHAKYFYNGEYPRDRAEEEFREWYRRVEAYISSLESEAKRKDSGAGQRR